MWKAKRLFQTGRSLVNLLSRAGRGSDDRSLPGNPLARVIEANLWRLSPRLKFYDHGHLNVTASEYRPE